MTTLGMWESIKQYLFGGCRTGCFSFDSYGNCLSTEYCTQGKIGWFIAIILFGISFGYILWKMVKKREEENK